MKTKIFVGTAIIMTHVLSAVAQEPPQLGKAPLEEVIKTMTIEEKVDLLVGPWHVSNENKEDAATIGLDGDLIPGTAGQTYALPRLGIPATVMADGPAGLRIAPTRPNDSRTYYTTHFPVGTLLASTWNTPLVYHIGQAMGDEVKRYGVDVILAPASNIHRNPLNGRNYEYYSEDPLLSGEMAAAMINGIQSQGVGTSLKHFALNNQEVNRRAMDVVISPRTFREIYLKPFEIAVKKAQPWTIMSSYNKINGTYAPERSDLLTTILRGEWGFEGMVMTDWFGGLNAVWSMEAGNDLMMPGVSKQRKDILTAVKNGTLSLEIIDRNVRRVLEYILRTPRFKGYEPTNDPDLAAHAAMVRTAAAEGMVLLKNDKATLPLNRKIENPALLGITSYDLIAGGSGSGDLNRAYKLTLAGELANTGFNIDSAWQQKYESYIQAETPKLVKRAWYMPKDRVPEMYVSQEELERLAKEKDIAFITIGKGSGEFIDRSLSNNFNLTNEERELIENTCAAFHKHGKKVVVVLNVCGVVETTSWRELPDAILLSWFGGQETGNTIVDVLTGRSNPSGRLPMTFPVTYADVPSKDNFPDVDRIPVKDIEEAMEDTRDTQDSIKRKNFDETIYEEGVFVGYRHYDTRNVQVAYPFGYGLSYTSFSHGTPVLKIANDTIMIHVEVKNTGKLAGKEVVQLYVSAPGKDMPKPVKELKGFSKTKLLQAGESEAITLRVPVSDLASFDESASSWKVEEGTYQFHIAADAENILSSLRADIKGKITETVLPVMLPVSQY